MCDEGKLTYGVQRRRGARTLIANYRRAIAALVLSLLGGWAALQFWPWLLYGSDAYWEWRCRHYNAPENLRAYDEYRDAVEATLANPGAEWRGDDRADGTAFVMYEPEAWTKCAKTRFRRQCPVFLHARRRMAGTQRLTVVLLKRLGEGYRSGVQLDAIALDGRAPWGRPASSVRLDLTGDARVRLYFGQPDPADDSHFTIKYEIDHVPGTIDGWLQPDDTVKLTIRDGPALLPAATSPSTQP